ncbi:hypothetical protein ACET3X_008657 [Alternaria dauci]|uniref:Uncharacterized protein n=1 Tax=Alternaria dauci TaxID=48095 RepID=A0ABR3UBI3_9PLEO
MEAQSLQPTRNPSLAKLTRDLGDDAALLRYLPYKRATFELQKEIPEAAPERLLYGDMLEGKDQLWIYFTLNSYTKRKSDYASMLTFQTIKGAAHHEASVRPGTVQAIARASLVFKYAQGYQAVEAVAKYFFIHRGIDKQLQFPVSSAPFRESLVRACQHYKDVYNKLQPGVPASRRPSIKTTGGSHRVDHARSLTVQESSRAAPATPLLSRSPLTSSMLSSTQSRLPSEAMSHGSSRAMSMSSLGGRKRKHSADTDQSRSSKLQDSHTQPGPSNASWYKPDDLSSSSQLRSSLLAVTPSPPRDEVVQEHAEETPVGENKNLEPERSADGDHLDSVDPDAMMDQYIELKTREEELDSKINDLETARANIADQVTQLQADMNAIDDRKEDLKQEKARMRADMKKLQIRLDGEEHLEFGFEAGRRMEAKRRRME